MIKTVLVTGASRGIGASIVKKLLLEKNSIERIVMVARDSSHYKQFNEDLKKLNSEKEIIALYADVGNTNEILSVCEQLKQKEVLIDAVINNAGYTNPQSVNEITEEIFLHTLKVNLLGPFLLIQTLIKQQQKIGLIINMASTAGINGRPGWLTYSASKAAVISMSEVMREELKPYGTRVVCLSPGRCATDLRRTLAPEEDLTKIMQPEHVADIVAIMCSDLGQLIDSQNIVIRK